MFLFIRFAAFLAVSFIWWPVALLDLGLKELIYRPVLASTALLVSLSGFAVYAIALASLVNFLRCHSLSVWLNVAILLIYVAGYLAHLKIDAKIAPMSA